MNRDGSQGSGPIDAQSNHSIEDLLSFFECNNGNCHHEGSKIMARPTRTIARRKQTKQRFNTDTHGERIDLGVRSCPPADGFVVDVGEKIQLFEQRGCYHRDDKSMKGSSCFDDLSSLTSHHNMVRRNSILFEEWNFTSYHEASPLNDGSKHTKQSRPKTRWRPLASKVLNGDTEKLYPTNLIHEIDVMNDAATELSNKHDEICATPTHHAPLSAASKMIDAHTTTSLVPHHERRSSTGRLVHFLSGDISTMSVWEFNDTFATLLSSPPYLPQHDIQEHKDEKVNDSPERRDSLQRRHSTGCVFDAINSDQECPTTTTRDFWQQYEQEISTSSSSSLSSLFGAPSSVLSQGLFVRRRTVQFAPHVTVFVFSGNENGLDSDLVFPQCFVRRASLLDSIQDDKNIKKTRNYLQSSEARFRPDCTHNNVFSNASRPPRRSQSADKLQLPQAHFDFSSSSFNLHDTSAAEVLPMAPRRIASNLLLKGGLPRLPTRRPSLSASETERETNDGNFVDLSDHERNNDSVSRVSSADSMISMTDYYVKGAASSECDEGTDDADVTSFAEASGASGDESESDMSLKSDDDDDTVSFHAAPRPGQTLHFMALRNIHDLHHDDDDRRARAMMWYHRWCFASRPSSPNVASSLVVACYYCDLQAMPTYTVMRRLVQNTSGLDITLEDIDLLPWKGT
eukprot:scaffold10368_cov180-Amphora_coffeaeformis.AAC.6